MWRCSHCLDPPPLPPACRPTVHPTWERRSGPWVVSPAAVEHKPRGCVAQCSAVQCSAAACRAHVGVVAEHYFCLRARCECPTAAAAAAATAAAAAAAATATAAAHTAVVCHTSCSLCSLCFLCSLCSLCSRLPCVSCTPMQARAAVTVCPVRRQWTEAAGARRCVEARLWEVRVCHPMLRGLVFAVGASICCGGVEGWSSVWVCKRDAHGLPVPPWHLLMRCSQLPRDAANTLPPRPRSLRLCSRERAMFECVQACKRESVQA